MNTSKEDLRHRKSIPSLSAVENGSASGPRMVKANGNATQTNYFDMDRLPHEKKTGMEPRRHTSPSLQSLSISRSSTCPDSAQPPLGPSLEHGVPGRQRTSGASSSSPKPPRIMRRSSTFEVPVSAFKRETKRFAIATEGDRAQRVKIHQQYSRNRIQHTNGKTTEVIRKSVRHLDPEKTFLPILIDVYSFRRTTRLYCRLHDKGHTAHLATVISGKSSQEEGTASSQDRFGTLQRSAARRIAGLLRNA